MMELLGQWSGMRRTCLFPSAARTIQRAPTSWQRPMIASHWEQVGVKEYCTRIGQKVLGLVVFGPVYVSDRFEATCDWI